MYGLVTQLCNKQLTELYIAANNNYLVVRSRGRVIGMCGHKNKLFERTIHALSWTT